MKKLLATLALSLAAIGASAASLVQTTTLANVELGVYTPGTDMATCNRLSIDLSGDLNSFNNWTVAGYLSCNSGMTYTVGGAGYLTTSNEIYFTVDVGLTRKMQCVLSTYSYRGTCTYVNSYGTAFNSSIYLK